MAVLISLLLLFGTTQAYAGLHWSQVAAHVGQNEESRDAALKALAKIEDLDQKLLTALDSAQRPLALDVISARKSEHLLPALLNRVAHDEDGYLVLCINSLLTNENKEKILTHYEAQLNSNKIQDLSAGAVVAMLEPLGRLHHPLPGPIVSSLFQHESFEVRISALSYVRNLILSKSQPSMVRFLPVALKTSPFQLRMQALYVLSEMRSKKMALPLNSKKVLEICKSEKKSFVKAECLKLASDIEFAGGT